MLSVQNLDNLTYFSSKAVPLLQFFFVCASVCIYMAFGLSLLVRHLSVFWCFGILAFAGYLHIYF